MPTSNVTVTSTAAQIIGANSTNRVSLAIINLSSSITLYFSFESGVTASGSLAGAPLLPGQSVTLTGPEAVFGITASSTAAVSVVEERKDGT